VKTVDGHLQVVLSQSISPPTDDHHLLVAFRFGPKPDGENHPAVAETHLDPIQHEHLYECWWITEPVSYRTDGNMRIAECSDYAVVIQDNDEDAGDDLEALTHQAYLELLSAVQSTDHKVLAKVWNYLGGINDGDGDFERYRRFSVGRAAAFSETNIIDIESPTGTGIGTGRDTGLAIIALASKHPLELAENPRQTSAFEYPRQYGPSSPKFARGGSVSNDKHTLYLLSGTAAIVGHESLHPYDVESQADETLRNLAALGETVAVLDKSSVLRVYLRDPNDIDVVARKLETELDTHSNQVAFLRGNICRRELVIEIDGVRVKQEA
jgi:chorismate lyase/3-hydroxybenzoate synthase